MNRDNIYRIRLRAVGKGTGYDVGEEITIYNDIFNRKNGLAFFPLNKDWEILSVDRDTQLKDKNGNSIFEGDVDEDYNVVTWCDKRNGWSLSVYDFPTKEFVFCHCYRCEGNFEINELPIKIIGNIYQHHHLLKQ